MVFTSPEDTPERITAPFPLPYMTLLRKRRTVSLRNTGTRTLNTKEVKVKHRKRGKSLPATSTGTESKSDNKEGWSLGIFAGC